MMFIYPYGPFCSYACRSRDFPSGPISEYSVRCAKKSETSLDEESIEVQTV